MRWTSVLAAPSEAGRIACRHPQPGPGQSHCARRSSARPGAGTGTSGGLLAKFHEAKKAAPRAVEQAGRGEAWDEVRRSLFGLTESGDVLIRGRPSMETPVTKRSGRLFAAALVLIAADLIDR